MVSPGKILVCGTNAYKPKCGYYQLSPSGHYYLVGDRKSGQGICPYDPKHNSTATVVGESFIFYILVYYFINSRKSFHVSFEL